MAEETTRQKDISVLLPKEAVQQPKGVVECRICYQPREPRKLSPCGHTLCGPCVAKLEQLANSGGGYRRCPFCRQEFQVLYSPAGLVGLCVAKMQWRLPRPDALRRIPADLRALVLAGLKNRRMLHGANLIELVRGLSVDILDVSDATNMTADDCNALSQLIARAPERLKLSNIPMLCDMGVEALLTLCASVLEDLDCSGAQERL